MSQVPSAAAVIPVVESLCCTSIVVPALIFWYASANFSITGVTEEEPATSTLPLAPLLLNAPVLDRLT